MGRWKAALGDLEELVRENKLKQAYKKVATLAKFDHQLPRVKTLIGTMGELFTEQSEIDNACKVYLKIFTKNLN
jgi:hypothetical protein